MATEFISVKSTLLDVLPKLDQFTARQAPFIIAKALTATASQVKDRIQAEIPKVFNNPTPYTMNSLYMRPATKTRLEAEVRIKDEAAKGIAPIKWLNAEIYGGDRNLKRSEVLLRASGILPSGMFLVPGQGLKLDSYGNVSGGQIQKILAQLKSNLDAYSNESIASRGRKRLRPQADARYFVIRPGDNKTKLKPGIYARYGFASGSSIKPIFMFVRKPHYKQRLKFFELGQEVIAKQIEPNLRDAYELAIATAR